MQQHVQQLQPDLINSRKPISESELFLKTLKKFVFFSCCGCFVLDGSVRSGY